jgi:hypothetical protein
MNGRLDDFGQRHSDAADPHAVDVAGGIELVGAFRRWRWRRDADDLFAVVEDQSHGESSHMGVGAQLADADQELRDAVVHAERRAHGEGHAHATSRIATAMVRHNTSEVPVR